MSERVKNKLVIIIFILQLKGKMKSLKIFLYECNLYNLQQHP